MTGSAAVSGLGAGVRGRGKQLVCVGECLVKRTRCRSRVLELTCGSGEERGRVADVGAVDDQHPPGRLLVGEVVLQLGEGLREPGREQLEASEGVVDVRGAGQSVTAGLGSRGSTRGGLRPRCRPAGAPRRSSGFLNGQVVHGHVVQAGLAQGLRVAAGAICGELPLPVWWIVARYPHAVRRSGRSGRPLRRPRHRGR